VFSLTSVSEWMRGVGYRIDVDVGVSVMMSVAVASERQIGGVNVMRYGVRRWMIDMNDDRRVRSDDGWSGVEH
jgi:hypothetical protein